MKLSYLASPILLTFFSARLNRSGDRNHDAGFSTQIEGGGYSSARASNAAWPGGNDVVLIRNDVRNRFPGRIAAADDAGVYRADRAGLVGDDHPHLHPGALGLNLSRSAVRAALPAALREELPSLHVKYMKAPECHAATSPPTTFRCRQAEQCNARPR